MEDRFEDGLDIDAERERRRNRRRDEMRRRKEKQRRIRKWLRVITVSYTHLTLPTIGG